MELQIVENENITVLNPIYKVNAVFTISDKKQEIASESIFDLKFDSQKLLKRIKKMYGTLNPKEIVYKYRR